VGFPTSTQVRRSGHTSCCATARRRREAELIAFFRSTWWRTMVPSEVEFRKELPKSMIGKILRRTLREEHERSKAVRGEGHAGR